MKIKLLIVCIFLSAVYPAYAQGLFDMFGADAKPNKVRVKFVEGDDKANEEILLVAINGPIFDRRDAETMPFQIVKDIQASLDADLKTAAKRRAIRGILLEINSPGGEVTLSDILYHKLKRFYEENKKPILVHFGAMGASGAYYVACAGQKIFAHPTSIVGSIGVLLQSMNLQRLAENIGIRAQTIKSDHTPMKDVLSPFKTMSQEEEKMLKAIIESTYERFIQIVQNSRSMSREAVLKAADGSIYSAQKAKELGLIDGVGYREDAIAELCKMIGLKSAALVKRVTKKSLSELFASLSEMSSPAEAIKAAVREQIEEAGTIRLMFK